MTDEGLRCLVVGSTSVVGETIIAELAGEWSVTTAGRRSADLHIDLSDPLAEVTTDQRFDVAVLVAADFGGNAPQDHVRAELVNGAGALAACKLAESAGIAHFVLVSTASAGYAPGDPYFGTYSLSKRHGEEAVSLYCSHREIALTILRPTGLYDASGHCRRHQPMLYGMIDRARAGADITINGSADPLRNFLFVSDFARIVKRVIEARVIGTFGCPGVQSLTVSEIAATAIEVLGRGGSVRFDSSRDDLPSLSSIPDAKLYEQLSYWPETDFSTGLRKVAEALEGRGDLMTTVMVTGVGAIIGYGVLRSLHAERPDVRLVGADIYDDAVGQTWCDVFTQAPLTSAQHYPEWLAHQTDLYEVDLLIPGIEQDVDFLCDRRTDLSSLRCETVVNTPQLVEITRDKWSMDERLSALGEESRIDTYNGGSFDQLADLLGVPFLLKPRRGYASKGIVQVDDEVTFSKNADRLGVELIAQQMVGSNDREFTVSIFGDGSGGYSAISCLQRKLGPEGSTAHTINRDPTEVAEVVTRLCAQFDPDGPTNLQFRQVGDTWKLLEINPRISSSTSLRAAFGYNEAVMCVDYFLNGVRPVQPPFISGRGSRYIEDVVTLDRNSV